MLTHCCIILLSFHLVWNFVSFQVNRWIFTSSIISCVLLNVLFLFWLQFLLLIVWIISFYIFITIFGIFIFLKIIILSSFIAFWSWPWFWFRSWIRYRFWFLIRIWFWLRISFHWSAWRLKWIWKFFNQCSKSNYN
jgi:hypothetical protein